jgi:sulfide dehydrogenase cytochrome subunit
MMRQILLAGLLAASPLGGPLLSQSAFAQSVDVTVLATSCATCHGPALEGAGAIPSLKGRRSADLAAAMKAFQSGERPATIMTRLSKGWSAAEIDALAVKLGEAK